MLPAVKPGASPAVLSTSRGCMPVYSQCIAIRPIPQKHRLSLSVVWTQPLRPSCRSRRPAQRRTGRIQSAAVACGLAGGGGRGGAHPTKAREMMIMTITRNLPGTESGVMSPYLPSRPSPLPRSPPHRHAARTCWAETGRWERRIAPRVSGGRALNTVALRTGGRQLPPGPEQAVAMSRPGSGRTHGRRGAQPSRRAAPRGKGEVGGGGGWGGSPPLTPVGPCVGPRRADPTVEMVVATK